MPESLRQSRLIASDGHEESKTRSLKSFPNKGLQALQAIAFILAPASSEYPG